jgi:hypothetical protein
MQKNGLITELLEGWADWAIRFSYGTIGYPAINNFQNYVENGRIIIRGSGVKNVPTNINAEMIEGFWRELYDYKQHLADVIKAWYFRDGFYQSTRAVASKLGLPKSTFDDRLSAAHKWMQERYNLELRKKVA